MPEIEKEIEQMADVLEKASKSPKEKLFDTIKELGSEGLKEKLLAKSEDGTPVLNENDRKILKSALEEMKKAVSMDDQYQAKYVEGNIKDTKLQEDKADDDQDEKLVKPQAANHNQQGTPTEGWEGQVIKAKEVEKDDGDEKKEKKTAKKITDAMDDLAEDEAEEAVDEHEDKMHKKQMKKALELIVGEDIDENDEDFEKAYMGFKKLKGKLSGKKGVTNPGALAAEIGRKKYGEKQFQQAAASGKKMKKAKDELDEVKKSAIEMLKAEGVEEITTELLKGKMKALLMEEKQSDDKLDDLQKEKTRGKKEKMPDQEQNEDANKKAQDKVDDTKQGKMKKSFDWDGPNALLRAGRGGQNTHFNVNKYYDNALEVMKKSEEGQKETLEKSNDQKELDINDYIEKSMDASRDEVICDAMIKSNQEKISGTFTKSFEDNEIAQALGLSEEEAKKILGE